MHAPMLAETTTIEGHGGTTIPAYWARSLGDGPHPAVVVVHHALGLDRESEEMTRRFADAGYLALCPDLQHRETRGQSPAEKMQAVMQAGGVLESDEQAVGDLGAAVSFLRRQPTSNGKVGIIGFCSGGRQSLLAACQLPLDAAIDCYGSPVLTTSDTTRDRHPVAPVDLTPQLGCPLLGIFGADDVYPSPAEVQGLAAALDEQKKDYDFRTFEGAGHAFLSTDRDFYRPNQAIEAWQVIGEFFDRNLRP